VAEPVKLFETSGGWICLCGLLGLDAGAGLVDPGLAGQLRRDWAPSAEPVRAGRVRGRTSEHTGEQRISSPVPWDAAEDEPVWGPLPGSMSPRLLRAVQVIMARSNAIPRS
jgi:hypothetical protein